MKTRKTGTQFSPTFWEHLGHREVTSPVTVLTTFCSQERCEHRWTSSSECQRRLKKKECPTENMRPSSQKFRDAYSLGRQELKKAAERRKRYYDLRVRPASFKVNDLVYYFSPRRYVGRSPKWQKQFTGPFRIIRQSGPVNYVIRRSARAKPFQAHVDKLRLCHEESQAAPSMEVAVAEPTDAEQQPAIAREGRRTKAESPRGNAQRRRRRQSTGNLQAHQGGELATPPADSHKEEQPVNANQGQTTEKVGPWGSAQRRSRRQSPGSLQVHEGGELPVSPNEDLQRPRRVVQRPARYRD